MNYKKLILPIGTALAALISNDAEAAKVPTDSQKDLSELQGMTKTSRDLTDQALKQLQYQMREQAHILTLHKSSSGVLYAQHGSHRSHASHTSHRSGY
jgi:hypothetical protein